MNKNYVIRRELFVMGKEDQIKQQYDFLKESGKGAYGKVYLARLKTFPYHLRAVKTIAKKNLRNPTQILNEIKVTGRLDHPHIVKLYETFEDAKHLFLVLDYCSGRELYDRLADCQAFSQQLASVLFRQMVVAVRYLHSQRVCHRDLKLENFMLASEEGWQLRLIDFGLSFPWNKSMRQQLAARQESKPVGTCYYMSPEVLAGKYDERCDIWSLGVLLYMMTTGTPPFQGEGEPEIMAKIQSGNYSLKTPQCKRLSSSLLDLISRILRPESQRASLEDIISHPWLVQPLQSGLSLKIEFGRLKGFADFSKIKKIVATFISAHLSENEMESLRGIFEGIDHNSDGFLTYQEFRGYFSREGLVAADEVEEMLGAADLDHNGKLNYNEFLSSCLDESFLSSEEYLRFVFAAFDLNKDGRIERDELSLILRAYSQEYRCNLQLVQELIAENDTNKDGAIDFSQFANSIKYIQQLPKRLGQKKN